MDSKVAAELIPPVYEDFDPSSEMVYEKDFDTILINLPGFRKDHLKVQLTTSKILRISGSRLVEGNKWRRFQKEFPVTPGRDPQRISAKFEGGILYVKVPMMIPTPAGKKDEKPPTIISTDDQKGSDHFKDQKDNDDNKKHHDHPSSIVAEPIDLSEKKDYNLEKKTNQEEEKKEDNRPEEEVKTRGLLEENKEMKNNASKDDDDDTIEKREKENPSENLDDDQANYQDDDDVHVKTRGENLQINDPLKLKKHRRMLNVVLVAMLAIAIGIYVSDFFKSLRRIKY